MEDWKKILDDIYSQAKRKGACDKFPIFKGDENIPHLSKLMFSPQGSEFCLKNRFPDMVTIRMVKKYEDLQENNIYVDAGDIVLYDRDCFLIGKTHATIRLTTLGKYNCFLMHGAKAHIEASGYSIVRVDNDAKSSYTIEKKDNAIILD